MLNILFLGSLCLGGIFWSPNQSIKAVNRSLAGQIIDHTANTPCHDFRTYSPILCEKRDLYIYLPPGYNPAKKYSLIMWLHGAFGDETPFPRTAAIAYLDQMIQMGCCPPVIVAAPDASIGGRNTLMARHSMFINGVHGNFEDHFIQEVIPFVMNHYSVRPEREAHVLSGYSGGGLPATSLAIKYRELFGLVTVISGPLNLRYSTCHGRYMENFSPTTFRWAEDYQPHQQVSRYWCGLIHVPARFFMKPIFGKDPNIIDKVETNNPSDLMFSRDLKPGELQIFIRYAGRDNFNFDAQIESFIWLATQRGIEISAFRDPKARHTTEYCTEAQKRAYDWLAPRLLPPTEEEQPGKSPEEVTSPDHRLPTPTTTQADAPVSSSSPTNGVPVQSDPSFSTS